MHSARRREMTSECETHLIRALEVKLKAMERDHLARFSELDGYDISAYDGHFHRHACHAVKDDKDRYRSVGGIYALDLRTGLIQRVVTTDFDNDKTNELRAFRDTFSPKNLEGLRKKTIAVVDKAYCDGNYWDLCRKMKKNGMYFISRAMGAYLYFLVDTHGEKENTLLYTRTPCVQYFLTMAIFENPYLE